MGATRYSTKCRYINYSRVYCMAMKLRIKEGALIIEESDIRSYSN